MGAAPDPHQAIDLLAAATKLITQQRHEIEQLNARLTALRAALASYQTSPAATHLSTPPTRGDTNQPAP